MNHLKRKLSRKMSSQIVKQGWIQKFSKGFMGEKWKRVYCRLYKDSSFFWFKNPDDPTSKGNVMLKTICNFLTVGSYVRAIPYSPELPSGARIDHVIAIPQEPRKKTKIHWFLCENDDDLNQWMAAICSTLPEPPKESEPEKAAQPPASPSLLKGQPIPGMPPSNPAGHIPPYPSAGSHPAQLGFESFTSNPPPYSTAPPASAPYVPHAPHAPPPSGSAPPPPAYNITPTAAATLQGAPPSYPQGMPPPPQGQQYPYAPPAGQGPPPPPGPQPGYPQQGYPYAYPQQQPPYQQQPYQQPPYQQQPYQQPPYGQQPYAQAPYGQQPPYAQVPIAGQPGYYPQAQGYMHGSMGNVPPPPGYQQGGFQQGAYGQAGGQFGNFRGAQTQPKDASNKGVGKMAAGLVGGAAAGYLAGRMMGGGPFGMGGFGWGRGFGHGSWGSGSWSGSWSGGSFGSFGSFD